MEVANILENKSKDKIYGLMGNIDITSNASNVSIVTDFKYNGTVKEYLNNPKDISSLHLVMLDEQIINERLDEMSEAEVKMVNLAKCLIENKEYVVLDYFEKGLNNREKENFKRLFKKLANNYHKTILIFTNDITFLWDICDEIMYVDNNNVINNFDKDNFKNLLDNIDKPEISKIIDLIREKNIKIEDYKNVLDLLKGIYRIKEEEHEISN